VVGGKVDKLDARVGALENRVSVVEAQGKAMPRAARQNAPAAVAPSPLPPLPEGEGKAAADDWQKDIKTSACYRVTIGRTKNDEQSKVNCHLRGYSKPAGKIGWDGDQELVDFFGEVLPWLSLEHFIPKGSKDTECYDVNFLVDWYRSKPNGMGKTFVNIDAVYPVS
jgi:hypothetical protein